MANRKPRKNRLHGFTIIIPLNTPVSFSTDYIHQTANILQKRNLVILFDYQQTVSLWNLLTKGKVRLSFVKSIKTILRNKKTGIVHVRPIGFIPFQRLRLIHSINIALGFYQLILLCRLKFRQPVGIWGFHPIMKKLIGKCNESFSLYDCLDYYGDVRTTEKQTLQNETSVLQHVTVASFISLALLKVKTAQCPTLRNKFITIPMGCDVFPFLTQREIYQKVAVIPKPRIGFIGHLNYRIHFPLLHRIVKQNPQWSFIFIGPEYLETQEDEMSKVHQNITLLKKCSNVYLMGEKSKQKLPQLLQGMDVCIIPYNTKYGSARLCSPMKAFEYLACGKPVVSTDIPALEELHTGAIRFGNTAGVFSEQIQWFLNHWSSSDSRNIRYFISAYAWPKRVAHIEKYLQQPGVINNI